ncbi:MAG TPA: cytochrome c peroxidase [Steroidobacteraceae bacterium]|nr:cytochrome c peroxidase [Steroidobacteraceae bacterium]
MLLGNYCGQRSSLARAILVSVFASILATSCGGGDGRGPAASTAAIDPATGLSLAATAGQALFSDTSLSVSGRQSCGTCHVPQHAFAQDPATDHGLPVPLGGPNMDQTGFRNTPSLMYASFTPPFSLDGGPVGGFFRDGRASSLAAQAQQPFLTDFEMANQTEGETIGRLQNSPATLQAFVAAYGQAVLSDPHAAMQDVGLALAAYETEDPDFHPFTSKFDYWQQGKATLSVDELAGLSLFNNPGKGNCTACHPSQAQSFSTHPLFTDFSFDNIGVPRNWQIPANTPGAVSPISGAPLVTVAPIDVPSDAGYAYYDMGLCGPLLPSANDVNARADLSATTTLCGIFKVPTLRNIALTSPYFHNGIFTDLHQVVEWYVTRDINNNYDNNPTPVAAGAGGNPYQAIGTFYTAADGSPDADQYNDLPVAYDANVNIVEVPYTPPTFAGGQAPTLTPQEIDQLVAFLCTLSDGFDPSDPGAYTVPSQCQPSAAQTALANQ